MTPLNRDPYKISTHNRQGHKGGGIALITESDLAIKLRSSGVKPTFEYATWEVSIGCKIITFMTIYHPPYSLINKSTNGMFLDEFTDYMTDLLPDSTNNIVMGDFNLHINKEDDVNSAIFMDTIEAMGLYQHVSFPTHQSGNTLDLIISELQNSIAIKTITPGPFISDHCAIISTLNIKKLPTERTNKEVRKTHKITTEEWMNEFDPNKVALNCNLEETVANLGIELKHTLDKLAPLKRCSISLRPKMPWYDKEMAQHKAKVRRKEKRWIRYKLPSCWIEFKNTRNSYYGRLNHKKKEIIRTQITDNTNNSKKLYALITNLTTKPNPIQWSVHKDKQKLADDFANYFQDKILQIRMRFDGIPGHEEPTDFSVPQLRKFAPLTKKEVVLTIKWMKTKSCELDDIPTDILKQMLPKVIGLITKIVNMSLKQGVYSTKWKVAMVKPLLKKLGLELINPKNRPVSNLPFISKVVENCMLLQLSRHCKDFNLQPDYQSADREDYSCEMAVLKISNDILWAFENQSIMSLVAIDLSAAFDTVDHTILLDLLNNKFGITDKALKWLDSYLCPRSFKVAIDKEYHSKVHNLEVSVH